MIAGTCDLEKAGRDRTYLAEVKALLSAPDWARAEAHRPAAGTAGNRLGSGRAGAGPGPAAPALEIPEPKTGLG